MIKTTFINSTLAQYSDKEISFAQDILLEKGYFADSNGNRTFNITENSPQSRSIIVKAGKVLVPFSKGGFSWKVLVENTSDSIINIPSSTGGYFDTVIVKVDQVTEPNLLKTNIATIELVRFNTATPTDTQIQNAIGSNYGFLVLGVVDALTGSTIITNSQITNSVNLIKLSKSIAVRQDELIVNENQIIINASIHSGTTLPISPYQGQVFLHTGILKWWDGVVWKIFPTSKFGGTGADGPFSLIGSIGTIFSSAVSFSQSVSTTSVFNTTIGTVQTLTISGSFNNRIQPGDTLNFNFGGSYTGTFTVLSVFSSNSIQVVINTNNTAVSLGTGWSLILSGQYGIIFGTGTNFTSAFLTPYINNSFFVGSQKYNVFSVSSDTYLETTIFSTFPPISIGSAYSPIYLWDFANASILEKNFTNFSITGNAGLGYKNVNSSTGGLAKIKVSGNLILTSTQTNFINLQGLGASANSSGVAIGIKPPEGGMGASGTGQSSTNVSAAAYVIAPKGTRISSFKGGVIPAFTGGGGGNGVSGANPQAQGGRGGGGIYFEVAGSFTGSGTATVAGVDATSVAVYTYSSYWGAQSGAGYFDGSAYGFLLGQTAQTAGGGGGGFFGVLYNTLISNTLSVNVGGGASTNGLGPGGNGISIFEQNDWKI